jgi:TetR/AcrR family transcriptional regulator, fatty acid metabolism regulator protein
MHYVNRLSANQANDPTGKSMVDKPLTKRQEQALETKNRIYTAAIELMDREGFENITIAEISEKAGVSVGAFYHYFESKNDILAEIFHQADEYFSTQVASGLTKGSIPDQIIGYFDHYARFNIASGVEMTQQLFSPKIKFFIKEGRPMLTILQDLVRRGQDKGEIRTDASPEEIVRLLFVMARGVVFEWSLYDGGYDLEETMHEYIARLVSTLRP